jgi:hypothetical protein
MCTRITSSIDLPVESNDPLRVLMAIVLSVVVAMILAG